MSWLIRTIDDDEIDAPVIEFKDVFVYAKQIARKKISYELKHRILFWKKPETITETEDVSFIFAIIPKGRIHSILWHEVSTKSAQSEK